jgi:iron complex outermembrane receptor protein
LLYQRASGFYASINLRVASSYYVDFGNSLAAPSYTLWGAKVGYQAPGDRWSVFLDARNLTDENYAAASNTAYNLRGADSPNFYPGDGFGIITGASYRF